MIVCFFIMFSSIFINSRKERRK